MTDHTEPKRGRGRPPTGEPVLIRLPPDLLAWIDRQPGNRAEAIRNIIRQAMEAEPS